MPTYQYVCTTCESPHEAVQGFDDDPLTDCPACDGGRLRKVYGSVGVVFKGSGFYRTDSRSASSSSTPAAPATPAGPSGGLHRRSSTGGSSTGGSSTGGSSTGGSSTGGSSTGGSSTGGSSTGSGSAA